MDREQFLKLFITKQYDLIAYHHYLENGKTNLKYENWSRQINTLFNYLIELCVNEGIPIITWNGVVNQIIENYFLQFSIVTVIGPDGKLIGYV